MEVPSLIFIKLTRRDFTASPGSFGKIFRIAAYLIGQDPSVLDFKDVSTNQNLAQIIVSYGDDTSILKLCCSSRKMDLANIDTEGYTALAKAVENGFYNSVKYLTSLDASQLSFEKKRTKSTLIHLAVQNNDNLLLLQFLLSSGSFDLSAIDSDGKTALAIAYQFGRTECAKYLVNRNPETASFISLKNENLAHFAARTITPCFWTCVSKMEYRFDVTE
ncbi:hypothetical protein BCR33DRAFT_219985 [Rhizoclosmatium globosum]|uniref:Uncharacterized protein n=1 Tax=Rhizoclosmatium globosum TaxID=329046 RepID=A0A1Y2CBG9_9FUNG|nr:hypothetical protein BCR33DRAFT_219985 [Rhizoclosmatium globosum]|eukprot:ORY44372.1 hypothetical protein BCR33DRAFT_219985 [Rhizoclosmatium globosum]